MIWVGTLSIFVLYTLLCFHSGSHGEVLIASLKRLFLYFLKDSESLTLCCFDVWVSLYFLQAVLTIQSVYGKVYWNRLRAPLLAYRLFHLFSLFLWS